MKIPGIYMLSGIYRKHVTPLPFAGSGNKVSHINTHDQGGGAARVAMDLVEGLSPEWDTRLFCAWKRNAHPQTEALNGKIPLKNIYQSLLHRLEHRLGAQDAAKTALCFSDHDHLAQSRLVHLHNMHGGYCSYGVLPFWLARKKVIWTLHDEHILTGHCAITRDCERWKNSCGNCPHLDTYPAVDKDFTGFWKKARQKWVNDLKPILVCPSGWLKNRVNYAFPELDVRLIPNGIKTSVYKPADRATLRKKYGIPEDAVVLLYAAELGTSNPFKGGDVVRSLVHLLPENPKTSLITVGEKLKPVHERHYPFGYISDENVMAELYALADLLLYPTQADNHPLTVLEAMACGTPVMASAIGGIPEIVHHDKNGWLVKDHKNPKAFLSVLENYLQLSSEARENIQNNAVHTVREQFSLTRCLRDYHQLYEECLK